MFDESSIFANLNDSQAHAVRTLEGPVLILAGAGSGKTRALTHRIAHLIARGIPAWQILAVTFTNKAANEMKERIANILNMTSAEDLGVGSWNLGFSGAKLPVMGTFHSVCVRILRRDIEHIGRNRDFAIYDAADQETLMKDVLKEMNIDVKELKPRTALGHIGRLKSEAVSAKAAAEESTTDWMARIVKIYELYQAKLRLNNALDFDDLLLETVRLFCECPTILERYQRTWRYIHVDEYQDTNHAQYLMMSLLAKEHGNLCVIGDPDQSIYAFRGADIRNILEFQNEYENAISIKLERNYRSTQQILDAADCVIAANPRRPQKKMWTKRIDGEKAHISEVADEKKEADAAVKLALEKLSHGISLNEQVVLYRTNAQSRLFEESCLRHGVPYRLVGGVKFYARREVKDILAYLSVLQNPADSLAMLRIINVPSRKIGKTTIGVIQEYCASRNITLWTALHEIDQIPGLTGPVGERLMAFADLISKFQNKTSISRVSEIASDILSETGMEKWIKDDTAEGEERWENIGELLNVMRKYDSLPPAESLQSFLEEVALVSEVDKLNEMQKDALTLMTLHLCKGLEFRHVMIAGCEENLFPHSNALFDRAQLEEERRLMYVGMTRAKDHLCMFHARSRMLWGTGQANPPSRFLDDLSSSLVERSSDTLMSSALWAVREAAVSSSRDNSPLSPFRQDDSIDLDFNQDTDLSGDDEDHSENLAKGSRISHPVFGTGTIASRKGDIIEVAFDSGVRKKLALSVAPISAI